MAPGFSQVLVDVLECDATIDHHDLQMVDELAHFFGRAISTLIFGGDPGLSSLFDNLLADEVRAFGKLIDGQGNRPAWWRLSRSIPRTAIQKSS